MYVYCRKTHVVCVGIVGGVRCVLWEESCVCCRSHVCIVGVMCVL